MAPTRLNVRGGKEVSRRARIYQSLVDGRGYSVKELAEEFGETRDQIWAEIRNARRNNVPFRRDEVAGLVIQYCKKNGVWPVGRDAWRNENGLPAQSTIQSMEGHQRWGWGRTVSWNEAHEQLQGEVARHPKLTAKIALMIPNMTHRRNAMARFTDVQLVKHMTLIDDDKQVGMLYHNGTESTMLRVINSTPEPDGSHAIYVLVAPPEMEKARQALAWTFGVTEGWESFVIQEES